MARGERELKLLSEIIVKNLLEEFAMKHLSGNLMESITVETLGDEINIHIPAETYNMLEFFRTGAIVKTYKGSYASKLDEEGSSFNIYPNGERKGSFRANYGNHKGYVERIIRESFQEWQGLIKGEAKWENY